VTATSVGLPRTARSGGSDAARTARRTNGSRATAPFTACNVSGARYATYRECERTARIINQPQRARALFRAGALSAQPAGVITAARGLCVVQRALFSLSSRCCRVARRVPRCARSLQHHAVARSRPSHALATWRACEKAARADEFPISRSAFALKGVSFLEREFLLCPGSKAHRRNARANARPGDDPGDLMREKCCRATLIGL